MRALTVANYLISKSRGTEQGTEWRRMSPLKLQKILYYAQGWHLGIYDAPLFADSIYAWKLGPVTKSVYDDLKQFGSQDLGDPNSPWQCSGAAVTDSATKSFLDFTWGTYAEETANQLVARTHGSDPWIMALANPFSKEITQASMREHFAKLV